MKSLDPATLPPTKSSASFHSLRVYLQVQQWKQEKCLLDPECWGWERKCDSLTPIMTDLDPAPMELLKVIR